MSNQDNELAKLCSQCCAGILMILYIVFAIIILNETSVAAGACNQVWIYCLVTLIIGGLSFLTGGLSEKDEHGKPKNNFTNSLISAILFGVFIWGCVIYTNVVHDNECHDLYTKTYPKLWTLFGVVFWFDVALLCLIGLLFCCYVGLVAVGK